MVALRVYDKHTYLEAYPATEDGICIEIGSTEDRQMCLIIHIQEDGAKELIAYLSKIFPNNEAK